MKRLAWMVGLLMLVLSCRQDMPQKATGVIPPGSGNGTAVSLKILQKRLAACMPGKNCPDELLRLAGLTHLRWLVEDTRHKDWILLGQEDLRHPPLFTEDIVVSLRNAFMKYATQRGDTLFYTPPGCSIDPEPEVLARLEQAAALIQARGSFGKVEKRLEVWRAICGRPQMVRVFGIPFHSHFGKVMVEADYFAKRLVDGSATVDTDGFLSLLDMTLNRIRNDFLNGRHRVDGISPMNRFEFVPGKTRYLDGEGIVLIDRCPVELVTEAEYLTRSGQRQGTGRPDPLAQKWASNFSARYSQIAEQKPFPYRQLESLFRITALAKILRLKTGGADLEYLLEEFPLEETPVPQTLPGISNVKEFRNVQENAGGRTEAHLWLPSCGGVRIEIEITPANFIRKEGLKRWTTAVLAARPAPETLSWNF